jgi:hypothetical protein
MREEGTRTSLRELTDSYNTNNESKTFPICYARGCVNTSRVFIRLPLNARVVCILRVCEKCSTKFLTSDEINEAGLVGSGSSQVVLEYVS